MLGEMIAEDQGKITGIRVLPAEGQGPRVEVCFQAAGKLVGLEFTEVGTYETTVAAAGICRGKGQGMLTLKDGEVVTWTGEGVGKQGKGMAASWRGAIYYQATSARLSSLNGMAAIFEHEVDEAGNLKSRIFEWK